MSRRDTIIIAVLVNLGLLAILFMTAIHFDSDVENEPIEATPIVQLEPPKTQQSMNREFFAQQNPVDEVDNALKDFVANSNLQTVVLEDEPVTYTESKPVAKTSNTTDLDPSTQYVEVTVKRGDVLDKIARANGTTIAAIKTANGLKTERLNIGQVLKVPVGKKKDVAKESSASEGLKPISVVEGDPVYYVIKPGDNPWKIAKQHKVKVDDLLSLNNLDEGKARNLKVGDKIRVK